MTKPPRKQPAKAGAKKVSPAVRNSGPRAKVCALDQVTAFFERVVGILEQAQARVVRAVNSEMVLAYWQIGREIVEHLQGGEDRAGYGEKLIEPLSEGLGGRFGRGYSTTNLRYFRAFYLACPARKREIRHIQGGESLAARRPAGPTVQDEIRQTRGGVLEDLERATLKAFARFEQYRADNGMRDKAFLKAAVFRMLRLRCEQGQHRLKEQLRDLMAPPATASDTAASSAPEAAA